MSGTVKKSTDGKPEKDAPEKAVANEAESTAGAPAEKVTELPVVDPGIVNGHLLMETVGSEKQSVSVDESGQVVIDQGRTDGEQTAAGIIPNPIIQVDSDSNSKSKKSDAKREVTFTKSPTGLFGLAYNVGETGSFEAKQADEIVNSGYGVFSDAEDASSKSVTDAEKR